jgi:cytochrome c peroxidase
LNSFHIALGSVFSFSEYYAQEGSPGGIPFLWGNSATSPQNQISRAFLAENEMGMVSGEDVVERVMEKDYYKVLYRYAYGTEVIDVNGIKDALRFICE